MKKETKEGILGGIIVSTIMIIIIGAVILFSYDSFTNSTEYRFCKEKDNFSIHYVQSYNFNDHTNVICDPSQKIYKVEKVCLEYDEFRENCNKYKYVEIHKRSKK